MNLRWLILSLLLCSCGTYHGNGGYRGANEYSGVGRFKPPSDYSDGIDSGDLAAGEMRERLSEDRAQYAPRDAFKLYWPVAAVHINRGFSRTPHHDGLDLGGRRGMPILAAHEGLVIYTGQSFNGYGKMVLLEYSNEWATLYGHMDSIVVREGQIVHAGDPLGEMGATGHATGVHLHFELMHNRVPVDPIPYLSSGKKLARANH